MEDSEKRPTLLRREGEDFELGTWDLVAVVVYFVAVFSVGMIVS